MSISKIRVKSAVIKNNDKNTTAHTTTTETTAATTTILPYKGTITNALTTGTITDTTTTSTSNAAITTSCITPTLEASSIILTNNNNNTTSTTTTTTIPGSPKNNDQSKAKILSSSTLSSAIPANKSGKTSTTNTTSTVTATNTTTNATATAITTTTSLALHSTASTATTTTTTTITTTTTLLPQTNLLKIEPFVPSLTNRPQKQTIRRSYSTLSNTTLRKHNNSYNNNNNNHLNKNQVNYRHHLEIQHRNGLTKAIGGKIENNGKGSVHSLISGLPKVLKHPATLRRRPALRGPITRQRSKSTSSSNSNSNRPITAQTAANSTIYSAGKGVDTPCNSPNAAVVIQQPNGICRIQRQAKEQEKLPDRVNYDKRGLTAIPIFENETNLRLLSLQHNLINTFHIPKEQKPELEPFTDAEVDKEDNKTTIVETANREQIINGLMVRNTEQLNILGNQTSQHQMHSLPHQHHHQHQHLHLNHNNKQRLPLAIAKPNVEQLQPQIPVPGQLMLPLNAPLPQSPLTFGSFILQRNKLLHRSINMNNCHVTTNNHKANLQHTAAHLRMGLRKSQSFVSNLNLQLNLNKRAAQNQRTALLKRNEGAKATLTSFDSSSSNLNTDSTQSSVLTTETEETTALGAEEESADTPLAIKNNQLIISYGNIFQNLVFLDLYDNQIERICNLDGLPSLTVLLLGKNRICDITGLSSLKATLRVLDLHGNKLCSVSNKINCLKELKSLNLAGNQIRQINHNDFLGLQHLKELNLKRNKLKRINGFQHLTALERLWLCHNDLHKVDDMASIAKAQNLIEITIENNPLTLAGDCVSFLVSYLPKLKSLSQMPITEQVRKAAMTWRSNKELSAANCNHSNREVFNIIRREEIISNARTNWELLRSQQMVQNSLKQQQQLLQQQQQQQQQQHRLANKNRKELEKITESNENNYDEFIKLPPIENHQPNTNSQPHKDMDVEEHSSTASSLGPNVNSSSSCYSSQDEDDNRPSQPNHIDKLMSSSLSSLSFLKSKQHQMENVINHASPNDNKHGEQPQSQPHSYPLHTITKQSCNPITTLGIATPTMATATTNCAPTLNLQFPMETNKVSGNQQNEAVTSTATSVSSLISSTHIATVTATNATISSSALVASTVSTSSSSSSSYSMAVGTTATATASTAIAKRYVTGSLMRSQTIVGTVTGAASSGGGGGGGGGVAGGGVSVSLAGGGYTNGYTVKTNTVTTANNIRCQSKLNPNVTTQTAAITATQQQTTVTVTTVTTATAMTMISPATTTGYSIASAMASNNNSLMASSLNGNNTSLTLNTTTKIPVTVVSNSITGIAATAATHTTAVQGTTAITAPCGATSTKLTAIEREREQGGDYLIEICGRYLNIYGQGALRFIDKQWNPTKANDVHTLNFSYINFNNIASILGRIKVRFVHAENFVFRETNITSLGQLNALAELQGITALSIDDEGNPITAKDLWREYAIYRLSHWGLKTLNGQEVTPQEIDKANNIYAGLSDLILWSMPDAMLQPLLMRLRLDESCTASKLQPKQWLRKPDNKSLRLVVGKEALQWKKSNNNQDIQQLPTPQQIRHLQNQWLNSGTDVLSNMAVSTFSSTNSALTTRERGKIHFTLMMENTCNAVEKLHKLEQIWPTMLLSIIRNTLLDYTQLDVYIRNLMAEIMK